MTSTVLLSPTSGELLAAEIRVSPKHLEEILELLASAPFPINPELDHTAPRSHSGSIPDLRFTT